MISVCAALLIGAPAAHAQEFSADRFTIRGFGTIGATTHDADGIEFRRDTGQAHGATSGNVDLETDSLAGLQVDARISPELDIVLQGVTHQRADGDWTPEMTQGFLRWSPDESLVLRGGRVGYDIYLLAESRQVGYSYLGVRPSPEFYGQITNDSIDGGDISYTRRAGRGLVRGRLFGGGGSGELAFADGTHRDAVGDVYGATLDYIWRGWTARVAFVQFNYEAGGEMPLLVGALRATAIPSAVAVADDLDKDVYRSDGMQIGFAYDDGPVLAQVMYGAASSNSLAGPEFDKTFALFGYRFGRWTPFVSHASSSDRNPVRDAGLPPIPQLAPLNAAVVATQQVARSTQRTSSFGVRYDLSSHFDFKLQVDFTDVKDSSLIFDQRPAPGGPVDLTVITAVLDFVF
jgi:predicted porin